MVSKPGKQEISLMSIILNITAKKITRVKASEIQADRKERQRNEKLRLVVLQGQGCRRQKS